MKAKLGFSKRALVVGGLLIGTAGLALAPTAANARNFIGVDVGPLSVGIGANEPDYYVAPAPAPTYVSPAPTTGYVEPAPTTYVPPQVIYRAPATTYEAPRSSRTTTTTTTYYNYPSETTTYYGYRPGVVPRASETQTIYYGQ
jgi:hypothetical protein